MNYKEEEEIKKNKMLRISEEIRKRIKEGLKIYAIRNDLVVSMTMRYIECNFSEESVYFVADYDFCKTPKRFSTYDFLNNTLFFTANEGWEVEKKKTEKHLKHIKAYIKEDKNRK